MRESTAHSIKHPYLDEVKKIRDCGSEDVLESLPHRKQGRPLLLGDKIDSMVQVYIRRVREQEVLCPLKLLSRPARGIMSTLNKTKLKEYGEHVDLNRYWALFATTYKFCLEEGHHSQKQIFCWELC